MALPDVPQPADPRNAARRNSSSAGGRWYRRKGETRIADVVDLHASCEREVPSRAGPCSFRSVERRHVGIRGGRPRPRSRSAFGAAERSAPGEGEVGRAGGEPLRPVGAASGAAGRSDAIGVGRRAVRSSVPRSGRHPANAKSGVAPVRSCSRPIRPTPPGEIGGRHEGGGSGSEARASSMRQVGTNGAKARSAGARPRPWRRPDRRARRLGDPKPPLPHGREVPATSARRTDARRSAPAGSATGARCR